MPAIATTAAAMSKFTKQTKIINIGHLPVSSFFLLYARSITLNLPCHPS